MKKKLSILLVFLIIASMLAACGGDSAAPSSEAAAASEQALSASEEAGEAVQDAPDPAPAGEPAAASAEEPEASAEETEPELDYVSPFPLEEPATLTAWAMWIPGIEQYVDSPMDTSVFKAMREKTNVTVEMSLASSPETAMTEINLLIASGDYPNLINNLSGYYAAGIDSAIDQEVIVNILDYEDIMPNYFQKLRDRDALEDATTAEGNIGVVYQVSKSTDTIQSGLTLRQDWMEDLGAEAPRTYDELHDLLLEFKSKYGVRQPLYVPKGGTPDTFFDGLGTGLNYVMNNEMGSAPWNYVEKDGGLEVVFGFMDDSYFEALKLLNDWYNDGLFNADYTELLTDNPDMSFNQALAIYALFNTAGTYNVNKRMDINYSQAQLDSREIWAEHNDTANNYPGAVTFNVDESERFYALYNDIDTYIDENLLGFIIGTTPLDQYDSFRDTLISMGIEECIELTQAALDRYNAR